MTVVLAIRCSDGLVLAADTQITQQDRGVSFPAAKLHPFGERAAWGGSGSRATLQDVERVLHDEAPEMLASDDLPREFRTRLKPVFEHHYAAVIEDVPGQPDAGGPAAYVLAAGYDDAGEPFIIECTPQVIVARYDDIGFHAIGSGSPMAQQAGALLAHFRMLERDLEHCLVVAVRVLDSLSSTEPKVGGPIQVYRLTREEAYLLDEEEVEERRAQVDRWVELEREVLDRLFEDG